MPFNSKVILFSVLLFVSTVCCSCTDILTITSYSHKMTDTSIYKKIAVVDFAHEAGPALGRAISDVMVIQLFKAGYNVVERDRLRHILSEQIFTKDGYKEMSDEEKVEKLGKVLNADVIITGKVINIQPPGYRRSGSNRLAYSHADLQIAARAFDLKTSEIIWINVVDVSSKAETGKYLKIYDYIVDPCAELVDSFKNANYQNKSAQSYKNREIKRLRKDRSF